MKHRGVVMFLAGVAGSLALGWLAFPIALYERVPQPVQFSHRLHNSDKGGLKCEDCHMQHEAFSGIPKVEKCAQCHSSPLGTTDGEKVLVERYVTPNREIQWQVYARQPDNVFFSHAYHTRRAGLKCEQCHGPHGDSETLRPLYRDRISGYSRDLDGRSTRRVSLTRHGAMRMDDCAGCHKQRGVQDSCLACHK